MADSFSLTSVTDRSDLLLGFFQEALAASEQEEFLAARRVRLGPIPLELHLSPHFHKRDWASPLNLCSLSDNIDSNSVEEKKCARIFVWDSSRPGSRFPAPPWGQNYVYTHRGDIRGYQSDRISVAFNFECRLLSLWDRESRIGIYWTPNAAGLKSYEWAAPLRTLLHWIGLDHGLVLTHAAAVGLNGRGLLLAGKGGSGKSTTSLACWNEGWQFVSDDYCWVAPGPVSKAHAIYKTAKLLPDQPIDLPHWQREELLSQEKDVFDLSCLGHGQLVQSLELVALLLPNLSGIDKANVRPAFVRDGLSGLSLSTMAQLAGAGPATMSLLQQTAASIPGFHLDLCHPVSAVPNVLRELLESQ